MALALGGVNDIVRQAIASNKTGNRINFLNVLRLMTRRSMEEWSRSGCLQCSGTIRSIKEAMAASSRFYK